MNNNNHHYGQYQPYYYSPYYSHNGNPVPQGDPSAALTSMMYYNTPAYYPYPPQDNQNYYYDQQRSMLTYDDLAHQTTPTPQPSRTPASLIHQQNTQPLEKPKFCCNRMLKTAMAIIQHEKLHVQCSDCDHKCLPSVMEEHEEIAHGKVSSKKKASRPDGIVPPNAPKINTPEELAAWIAARKKNWPSRANIERKEEEDKAKVARGELMSNKRKAATAEHHAKKTKTADQLVQYSSDSESSDIDPEKDGVTSKDPSAMGKILLPEDRPKRRCKYFISGRCKRGDECTFLHEKPEPKPKQPRPTPAINRRPNLLFKLLEKEIQQEKNVILQCLRHLVDHDFLGLQKVTAVQPKEIAHSDHSIDNPMDSIIQPEDSVGSITQPEESTSNLNEASVNEEELTGEI
ncbi:hypothetical protein EDC96DRAFT_507565 [Choanephora cucurbitarum]|nr:hypothetical protein EDC96DRAFT_507565 [Choanephora cucurbitarum]